MEFGFKFLFHCSDPVWYRFALCECSPVWSCRFSYNCSQNDGDDVADNDSNSLCTSVSCWWPSIENTLMVVLSATTATSRPVRPVLSSHFPASQSPEETTSYPVSTDIINAHSQSVTRTLFPPPRTIRNCRCLSVCLSLCLSVCLLATLRKNVWTDPHEISGKVGNGPVNKWLSFGGDPGRGSGYGSRHW